MKRAALERNHCLRQMQVADRTGRYLHAGRFRKRKALDCGNSHCYVCHNDKLPRRNHTRSQHRMWRDIQDQAHETATQG